MKKRIVAMVLAVVCVCVFALSQRPVSAQDRKPENTPVVSVVNSDQKVLETRFLNMLNHNCLYNDGFVSADSIVDAAVVALLEKRDAVNDDFIELSLIDDYIVNMYGIDCIDYSAVEDGMPTRDGYVYIVPKGFSKYEHEILSLTANEDGSFSVKSRVNITRHDGAVQTVNCNSLFVKNDASQFGFNLIRSDFETGSDMM